MSDTSPLRALAFLRELDLLRQLFETVLVPPAVTHELADPDWGDVSIDVTQIPFIQVRSPVDQATVARLLQQLDQGESEAIALALEVRPDFILIDELAGRELAERYGLRPLGLLGVLLRAKQNGLIDAVTRRIDLLRDELGFYVSEDVRKAVIRMAGE